MDWNRLVRAVALVGAFFGIVILVGFILDWLFSIFGGAAVAAVFIFGFFVFIVAAVYAELD